MSGVITSLKLQARNTNRVNIFLDQEYSFSLAKILAAGLKIGQLLTDEYISELKLQDAEEEAYQRALRMIARRPHAERELRRKLDRREIDEQTLDSVIQRLKEHGWLDDQAFAAAWVENRRVFRPRSARALRSELHGKGVSREAVEASLEGYDESIAAYDAGEKAARRWRNVERDVFYQRIDGYLARRGFSFATRSPIVDRLWREINGADNESEEDQ
ncbi:MAG: regulatory protein RecX [Anaerolineales bacterium]|nr:regulatory protein RecX [Anaerolineales bacterium]